MTKVEKWMLKHYTQDLDTIKCNYCEEIFSDCNRMQNFKYHLSNIHNVLELDEHPEYDNIQQNYKISSPMATCNHCKKTINLAFHGVHVLTIHLKIFHLDKLIEISHVRDKYDITDNKATCKGCKKTLKIRTNVASTNVALHKHLHHCPHFKINFAHKKKSTEKKITQKRSHIWDKYDVTDNNATCKGCKKTLKTKITCVYAGSVLRQHLHYCPHFKIDFPLKKEITYDPTRKKSHMWDKYDVTGDKITCKGCRKTLKIKVTSINVAGSLRSHLLRCPHFRIDDGSKKRTRKKSHVWDKFDVIDSNATCKGCKKIIKITGLYVASRLIKHLHYCPHFRIDVESKKRITRKKSRVWDKFDVIDSNATCKGCKKIIKITRLQAASRLIKHLHYCPHFKTDFPFENMKIDQINKRSHVWDKYDVIDNKATCKKCKKIIKITRSQAASRLLQHLGFCSGKEQIMIKRSHVWDKYDVIDNNATCKGCKKTIKVTNKKSRAATLHQHLRHCSHFRIDFENKQVTRKRSRVWDKYDDNGTCKGCKKTIKITGSDAASRLLSHLRYCPIEKAQITPNSCTLSKYSIFDTSIQRTFSHDTKFFSNTGK